MSDKASEFTGQVLSELCDLLGVTKIRMSHIIRRPTAP